METVAEAWVSYQQKVLPVNASRIQVSETRRAFYAGAVAMQSLMVENAGKGDDDEGVKWMQARADELRRFNQEVKRGRK